MISRDEFIVEVWEGLDKDVVGLTELGLIENAVAQRFGVHISPASIARVLADRGARLGHPEILRADSRWREKQLLFTPEDLEITSLEAALALVRRIEHLHVHFETDPMMLERLRHYVRQFKADLDAFTATTQTGQKKRELAREVAQWFSVWLQNPQIFSEWLTLRQNTPEFRERFLS